jgi:CDP-paratose 2-epimerase
MSFQHALVAGGAGFIGSALAIRLRAAGLSARVTALDSLRRRGSELQLQRLREAGVAFLHGDTRNPADIEAAGPFDILVDCAAEPSVHAGVHGTPKPVLDHNLIGTIHCLEACRQHGAAFLLLSTSRVYPIEPLNAIRFVERDTRFEWDVTALPHGVSPEGVGEDMNLDGHRSFYGASKLCSELLVREYAAGYGLKALINRCGVIAGPWQMGKVDQGVVALWVAAHHFRRPLAYIGWGGTGKQVRDVLHVDDLADLVAIQLTTTESWDGSVFNVGGGRTVSASLLELTALVRHVTGQHIEIGSVKDTHAVDMRVYLSDTSRLRNRFDWRPRKDMASIVADTHDWVRQYEPQLRPFLG